MMETLFEDIVYYFSTAWQYMRNIIDILIVAFIIYWVYRFLSRTRAIQLLKGIFIILILAMVSSVLRLDTLDWLIKNISAYVVLTIVILFQPELRRLITQFGQKNWLATESSRELFQLDELVNAVKSMADERIGSIIVLERNADLRGYAESGVAVNATMSEEFIRTIFFPLTPLHDGAIIIQDGKIAAAACYLPLSDSKQLKKHHGARHRAALGIAEETDALVLLTSEETGTTSIMANGKIFPRVKDIDIKNMILYFMNPKTAGNESYEI